MAIVSRPIIGLRIGERLQAPEPPAPLIDSATLTRPSAAWAWGSDQLLDEYAADELRRDHDPATGAFRGVLVEESRTNQLLDNRDLSTGNWGATADVSLAQDNVGLDGQPNTAWSITNTNTGITERVFQNLAVSDDSNTHVAQFPLQKGNSVSAQLRLGLSGGSTELVSALTIDTTDGSLTVNAGTGRVVDLGDYWNFILEVTNNSSGNTNLYYRVYCDRDGTGQTTVFDWGQAELNTATPSRLIETDGTATPRAADVLEGSFSESSGTLHFVGEHKGGDGVLWQMDDGTEDNRVRLEVSGGDILFVVDDGGVNQVSLNAGTLASDGTYSLAARFDGSDFAISLDGATAVTAASGTVPSVTTQRFGRDTSATAGLNWYKTANHRANKLTDSELEALTAAPAPSCSANLTGDVTASFGFTPFETIESDYAETTAEEQRGVSTPLFTVDWSGTRSIEFDIAAAIAGANIQLYEIVGGSPVSVAGSGNLDGDTATFRVSGNGDVAFLRNGSESTSGTIGDLSNDIVILAQNGDASYGAMTVTAKAGQDQQHGVDQDWCGNAI